MKWSRFICFAQFYRRIGPDYYGGNGGTLGHSSGWFPVQSNCLWSPLWPAQHVLVLVVRLVHCYLSIARGRFYCWVDNCVISLACPAVWISTEYMGHWKYFTRDMHDIIEDGSCCWCVLPTPQLVLTVFLLGVSWCCCFSFMQVIK